MMNPAILFKLQGAWKNFTQNHPKFPAFLQAVGSSSIEAGSVVEITITTQEGEALQSNVRLTESDMELIRSIKELTSKG